jgi:hypothetical protein
MVGKKRSGWMMKIKPWELVVLALLSAVAWAALVALLGAHLMGVSVILAIVIFGLSIALVVAARTWHYNVWLYAGLFFLVALFCAYPALARLFPIETPQPFDIGMAISLLLIYTAALFVAVLLIYWGMELYRQWRDADRAETATRKQAGRVAVFAFTLSALLITKVLHSFYWFMLWDTTYDSLNFLWFFFLAPGVLLSIALLFVVLPGRAKLAGIGYMIVIPVMIVVGVLAQRVDFRQLTEARAARVSRAVEAYYEGHGTYPADLGQLTPRYALSLPGPVILYYGQDWCYDAGTDYYRLGYVTREHWSDPRLIGQLSQSGGEVPELDNMCAQEVLVLQKRFSSYPLEYWQERQ